MFVLHIFAPLAQLVEQQTLNLMVGGSIPLWRTNKKKANVQFAFFSYFDSPSKGLLSECFIFLLPANPVANCSYKCEEGFSLYF